MAGDVTQPAVTVISTDLLYRGINPQFWQQGQVTSGVFMLRRKDTLEKGPSVAIEKLVPLNVFHDLMPAGWGVGALDASVPIELTLIVHPLPAPDWKEYANAHAVITGYQKWGERARTDAEHKLKNELQKRILIPPS